MTTVGDRPATDGRMWQSAPGAHFPLAGGQPGGPTGPRRTSVARLVYRFALAGLLTMFLVALATGLVSRHIATTQAVSDARDIAWITGNGIIQPALTDALADGDPNAIAALDPVVRSSVLRNSLVRVKIWRPDGTIVYSDEPRLIGRQFDLGAAEQRVLRTDNALAHVSDLEEEENQYEPPDAKLLEVYEPIEAPSGQKLLYEAYFSYSGVAADGRSTWLSFAVPAIGEERERLLLRAVEASDAERRRIASDLHDGVVQNLTGVSFALTAEVLKPSPNHAEVLATSAAQVRDGITALRSLLVDIYPPNLAEEGIESAVTDLFGQLRSRGIATELQIDLDVALDIATAGLLYRTAQEAVRNVVSHAQASRVVLHLDADAGQVRLSVEDDGRGIDPATLEDQVGDGHLGLRLLAGLIADAGGTLDAWSAPGAGTCLVARLPLQ